MGRDQLVDRLRPPGAGRVDADRRRVVEQPRRDLPQPLDAVGGAEQRVVAAHGVEDQPLVGLQHVVARGRCRAARNCRLCLASRMPGPGFLP